MKVQIVSFLPRSHGLVFETWTLDANGQAVCDRPNAQKSAEIRGVATPTGRYYPKDGEAFLQGLKYEYINCTGTDAVYVDE